MRVPSNGSPVVKSRGPMRAPDLERFAVLHRLERVRRGIADRRDAPGQKRAAERLAVVLAQMRVDFDQAGNHRLVRRVDDRAGVQRGPMRLDALDAIAVDDDVDVVLEGIGAAVPETAGVNGLGPDGN